MTPPYTSNEFKTLADYVEAMISGRLVRVEPGGAYAPLVPWMATAIVSGQISALIGRDGKNLDCFVFQDYTGAHTRAYAGELILKRADGGLEALWKPQELDVVWLPAVLKIPPWTPSAGE